MSSVEKVWNYFSFCCIFLFPEFASSEPIALPEAELQIKRLFARVSILRDDQDKKQLADGTNTYF